MSRQTKKYIQLDAAGICVHEFEHMGEAPQNVPADLMDVTSRPDGIWLGKKYDRAADTFAYPDPTASLTASESSIASGDKVTLTWETQHAVSAEISVTGGTVIHRCEPVGSGSVEVAPGTDRDLHADGHGPRGHDPGHGPRDGDGELTMPEIAATFGFAAGLAVGYVHRPRSARRASITSSPASIKRAQEPIVDGEFARKFWLEFQGFHEKLKTKN